MGNENENRIEQIMITTSNTMPTISGFSGFSMDGNGFIIGSNYGSPETMPKEANTYLYIQNGQVRIANYKNGHRISDIGIMGSIADIQVLNEKVVMVTFSDGTTEKAVLDRYDVFSIEQGIAICIMKKSFSNISYGNGSSVYNKLVEYGLKTYENNHISLSQFSFLPITTNL